MRVEAETTLADVEALYDELIATHQAVQEAHTDEWEKRWAGDAVTLAMIDKERAIEAVKRAQRDVDNPRTSFGQAPPAHRMEPEAVSFRLDSARYADATQKDFVEEELAIAREKLRSAKGGSVTPHTFSAIVRVGDLHRPHQPRLHPPLSPRGANIAMGRLP